MTTDSTKLKLDRKLSHSSMNLWRQCRAAYHFKYIQDYDPPPTIGLIRGKVCHSAMGSWYTDYDEEKAIEIASAEFMQYEELLGETYDKDWDLTELVLRRYCNWSLENDDFEETLGIEERFDFVLDGVAIVGYIDGIVKMGGANWLLEHKFLKQARTKGLSLDPQVSLYLYAARKLGYNPRGVLYNVVRVAKGGIAATEPVIRIPLYRNNEGLKFIEGELKAQIGEMVDVHKTGGVIYRSPTNDCTWKCGFYDVCLSLNDDGTMNSVLETLPKRHERIMGDR